MDALKAAFMRDSGSYIMWVYSEAKVVPLIRFDCQGGYAKVCKVRIEGMSMIPAHVHFAGKLSSKGTNAMRGWNGQWRLWYAR